jgi:hypothetical protein
LSSQDVKTLDNERALDVCYRKPRPVPCPLVIILFWTAPCPASLMAPMTIGTRRHFLQCKQHPALPFRLISSMIRLVDRHTARISLRPAVAIMAKQHRRQISPIRPVAFLGN